jgi:pre-mRNA-splicing factor CDC5/CEF1
VERKKQQCKALNTEDREHQTKFIPTRDAQIQKFKEAEPIQQHALLTTQVGEAKLENIGQASESAGGRWY